MNRSITPKRLRQTTVFESFNLSKKKKLSSSCSPDKGEEDNQEIKPIQMSEIGKHKETNVNKMIENVTSHDEIHIIEREQGEGSPNITKSIVTESDLEMEKATCSKNEKDLFSASDNSSDLFLDEVSSPVAPASPESVSSICERKSPETSNESIPSQDLEASIENLMLNRSPFCCETLPKLWPSSDHVVLFNCFYNVGSQVKPYPPQFKDSWDTNYVRLPCSASSMYPVKDSDTGDEVILPRWEMIEKALLNNISSSYDLEEAILSYNTKYQNRWNFNDLHQFFRESLEPEESREFFKNLLPKMVALALRLPHLCTSPIPMLRKGHIRSLTISQLQIGSLLANAFFCTFPRRNSRNRSRKTDNRDGEYYTYPEINFNRFFAHSNLVYKPEKLKCIFNYFARITKKEPTGIVTFERRHTKFSPNWANSLKKLTKLYAFNQGTIEKHGSGLLQVDFANKYVGGGVLGHGCVQEEIRFLICPELIVSKLFTESLNENEVLIVTGCEQFNDYSGYSNTFKWEGNYVDETPIDAWGRRHTQVLAMDALHFYNKMVQYQPKFILRELNKAFSGFYEAKPKQNLTAIATGNWGCGVFNGDPRLKVLLQLQAASESDRDLIYFTFGDSDLKSDIEALYDYLIQRETTVGDLFKILLEYAKYLKKENNTPKSLYAFIYDFYSENSSNATTINFDSQEL